jgi:hypothetical protein
MSDIAAMSLGHLWVADQTFGKRPALWSDARQFLQVLNLVPRLAQWSSGRESALPIRRPGHVRNFQIVSWLGGIDAAGGVSGTSIALE